MLCRAEMPSNEQIYGRYYRYMMFKGPDSSRKNNMLMMLIVGVVAIFLLYTMAIQMIILVGVAVLMVGYVIYSLYIRPGQIFRKKEGVALQTEVYIFTDSNFTRSIRSEESRIPENTFTRYDGLLKAVETSKDFYFFTGQSQAYTLDKEYFTKGTVEDLSAQLAKVMGKKFISKSNKIAKAGKLGK